MANQIKKKYIENDAIDGLKLLLQSDQTLRRLLQDGSTQDVIAYLEGLISSEETRAIAAETGIDTRITTLEGQVGVDLQDAIVQLQSEISQEASNRETADTNIQSQITAIQGAQDVLFEDDSSVYADGTAPIEDPTGRDGWFYKSAGSLDKINWYFHDGQANPVTVGEFDRLYTVATVDSSSNDTFHLSYYTVPQGDGDADSWYRSRIVYVPSGNFERGVKTLFYMGQEPDASVYPDLPRVQMTESTVAGSSIGLNEDTEVILTAVLSTNSAAPANSIEILVNKLGFNSSVYNKEYSLEIRDEFTLAGVKQSLLEEAIERQAADTAIREDVEAAFDSLKDSGNGDYDSSGRGDLHDEFGKLEAADTTLQGNIDAEASARQDADDVLQGQIDTLNGDSSVEGSVAKAIADVIDMAPEALNTLNELAASIGDDENFAGSVTQQITDAKNELKGSVSEAFDTMKEIEDEFTKLNGDSSVEGSIDQKVGVEASARQDADTTLQNNIDAEKSRAEAAEGVLQSNIDAEVSARQAADTTLQSNIDAEKSRAEAAEGVLQSNIDAEKSRAEAAEGVLQSNIDAEVSARQAADTTLQSNIDAEVSARQAADTTLQSNIDAEVSARQAAEAALKGDAGIEYDTLGKLEDKIQAEASARENADDVLQGQIDTLNGDSSVEGSVAKAIADVVGTAPEALDTLGEIATSLANDPNLDSTLRTLIDTNIDNAKNELKGSVSEAFDTMKEIEDEFTKLNGDSSVAGSIDQKVAAADTALHATISAEVEAAFDSLKDSGNGDYDSSGRGDLHDEFGKLEGRLDVIEALAFYKESAVVVADSNEFTLLNEPKANSLSVFIGRLALIEGVDYSVSVKKVTIEGDLAFGSGSSEEMAAGENIYFQYYSGDSGSTGGDSGSTGGDSGSTGGDSGSTGGDSGSTGGDSGSNPGSQYSQLFDFNMNEVVWDEEQMKFITLEDGSDPYSTELYDINGTMVFDGAVWIEISSNYPGSEYPQLYDEGGVEVFWNDTEQWYAFQDENVIAPGSTLFSGPNAPDGTSIMVYNGSEWGEWSFNQSTGNYDPMP